MTVRRRILFILLPLLLVTIGAAAYLLLAPPGGAAPPDARKETTYSIAIEELVVNLADQDRGRYLTASIMLVLTGPGADAIAAAREAQIRDAVVMTTTQHTYRALIPVAGKETLKKDLAAAVDEVLIEHGVRVQEVLFTSFLMD